MLENKTSLNLLLVNDSNEAIPSLVKQNATQVQWAALKAFICGNLETLCFIDYAEQNYYQMIQNSQFLQDMQT